MSPAPERNGPDWIRLWNAWLKTPDGRDYVGWCNCEWCHTHRERGRAWVEARLKAEKQEQST